MSEKFKVPLSVCVLLVMSANMIAEEKDNHDFPDLPESITSFGAAIVNGSLYTYGGHTGRAHSYYKEAQNDKLQRLDLNHPEKGWETLDEGLGLQGLALVGYKDKLIRIGGFTAKNSDGEDADLESQTSVSIYDPKFKRWKDLPPLPEPRSSFDAVIDGSMIYVIGGWSMQGAKETTWHKTAYVMDVSKEEPKWKALPTPPFQRRALSLGAYQGKIYAIGGMQKEGGPTTRVDIYDPKTEKWSLAPKLNGEAMEGFGSSAFSLKSGLFVSTIQGNLQRLADDGKSWETVKKLERARFFHRMLPFNEDEFLILGGASMKSGKYYEIDVVKIKD
jgi:N-acetylneuraminic acid mutarotase